MRSRADGRPGGKVARDQQGILSARSRFGSTVMRSNRNVGGNVVEAGGTWSKADTVRRFTHTSEPVSGADRQRAYGCTEFVFRFDHAPIAPTNAARLQQTHRALALAHVMRSRNLAVMTPMKARAVRRFGAAGLVLTL